ncbi:MAG TPA: serine hydrolase [Pyrinomonadaceae bacterium]|jgi:CubicO group peptidase (beta-lactamase class C family)
MIQIKFLRLFTALLLVFAFINFPLATIGYAQTSTQTAVSDDMQARLARIEEKIEARRKELGIPGISLVIVKDDKIIYMKGLGYKDFAKQIPVTPDTQFAIGSATKAFTALSVLMSQDEGKLSLDDSPKKYLTYFKINDPEIDSKITIRDLLSHSSGLNRTDLAMVTGKLNREELIKVAGEAKPTAKLREKFQYQNLMFTAAGEIVAKVQKEPWEKFIPERVFAPLGMTNSTMSVAEMQKAKDYSFGYDYNFDTKETRNLPTRDILQVAPAGSINSSARDMAQWLRFVINGGSVNGKRLVSEKSFEEWTKPQMKIAGTSSYGLGWFLRDWKGMKMVEHGGNIDGFNAQVTMLPEKKLGFVMLTNVSGSPLPTLSAPIIFEGLLGELESPKSNDTASVAPEKEVGKYRFEPAGFDVEVKIVDGKLVSMAPGQPTLTLENVGGRRYKLKGAPDGFFITFKENELYLEQPQGNYTLPKLSADGKIIKSSISSATDSVKDLIGKYQTPNGKGTIEIKEVSGKVSLVVGTQQPYELKEKSKDVYSTVPLPDSYFLKVRRDANGKLEGITMVQPEGEFAFKYIGAGEKTEMPKITVDELMAKTIDALGGEAAMRKVNSREMKFEIDFEHQGVKGFGTSYAKAPNLSATDSTLTALGKTIATSYDYFDGTTAGDWSSFSPADTFTGQRLEDIKYENDFYGLLNWKKGLKSSEITGTEKVGDEETYVVVLHPEKASEVTYYISTKTFLPLKKKSLIVSSTSSQKVPITTILSDYRSVDGLMMPFKSVAAHPGMGNIVTYVKDVKNNVAIDDKVFKARK